MQTLAKKGESALQALATVLKTSSSVDARRNAIWAATRIPSAPARDVVRAALNDGDASVRQAALHSVGLWRDAAALPSLVAALKSNLPAVQRAAAEALGRIGDRRAVPDLLAVAATPLDRTLEHSVTYALIEIADPTSTTLGLQASSSRAKRIALIALDQMDGGGLKPEAVISLFASPDPILRDTAWWIAGHHQDWGGTLAGFFKNQLTSTSLSATERDDLQQKLVQFGENPAIQELLAAIVETAVAKDDRLTALKAMSKTRAKEMPAAWHAPIVRALSSDDGDVVRQALSVARVVPVNQQGASDLHTALLRIAGSRSAPIDVRLEALAAVPGGLSAVDRDTFDVLRAGLEPTQPAAIRVAAAGVIEKAKFDRGQLLTLADSIKGSGPLELSRLLTAFDQGSDEALGLALVAALKQSKGRSSVRADVLRPRLAKYPPSVQNAGEALLASLNVDAAKQAQRLEVLLTSLQGGDIRRGQTVFNSPKVACLSCHSIGYMGGKIGPDLTRIGQVRSERDLLEAIVFPSASFARGFEPVVVTTEAGETHSGVLRSDLADVVVLATAAGAETRILRRDIVDMQPGTVSVMPPGLDEQLTRQELADLVAFLKATRSGAH